MKREIIFLLLLLPFGAQAHECAPQNYYEEQKDHWAQQRRLAREQERQMEEIEMRQIRMEHQQQLEQFRQFSR